MHRPFGWVDRAESESELDPSGLASLASAALRAALERRACASAGARVELIPAADHLRVALYVSTTVPWRVSLAALADVIATVRMFEPSVRMSDAIFEPLETRG